MDKIYLIIDNASNKLVAKESDYGNATIGPILDSDDIK